MFFTGVAADANVAGALKFIQRELNRASEMAGLPRDFGGMPGIVSEQPSHDLGARLAAEEGAELEQEIAGVIHARGNGLTAIARGAALPAVGEEIRIGGAEVTEAGEQGCRDRGGRGGGLDHNAPLFMGGQANEAGGDGGENRGVAERVAFLQVGQTLEIDPVCLVLEPIEHLVEEAGVEAAQRGGGKEKSLRVEDHVSRRGFGMAGHAKGGPLGP